MKIRPMIYVAGPFRAKPDVTNQWVQEQNIRKAEQVSWDLFFMGAAPICPHTMTRFFQGSLPDEVFLQADLDIIRRCDAIYLVDGWERSVGTRAELALAVELNIDVLRSMEQVQEYVDSFIYSDFSRGGAGRRPRDPVGAV